MSREGSKRSLKIQIFLEGACPQTPLAQHAGVQHVIDMGLPTAHPDSN